MTVTDVQNMSYSEYVYTLNNPSAREYMINLVDSVNSGQISQYEFAQQVESVTGKKVVPYRSASGRILGYNLEEVATVTNSNPINSNASTVSRGKIARPISTTVNSSGKAVTSALRGLGTKVATGAALIGTAATCVGVGITLGKTIDSALYNAFPDFFDSNGMGGFNPETWRNITANDDSWNASLINFLFGFDEDGNGQAYIDEDAFAYMAAYMQSQGVFDAAGGVPGFEPTESGITLVNNVPYPVLISDPYEATVYPPQNNRTFQAVSSNVQYQVRVLDQPNNYQTTYIFSDTTPIVYNDSSSGNINGNSYTLSGKTIYYAKMFGYQNAVGVLQPTANNDFGTPINRNKILDDLIRILYFNEYEPTMGIEGIGTQTGATTPQLSGTDIPTTLQELQQQYPDLWNNALQYPVIQDDGTVKQYTYLPISLPEYFTRTDTQPTSGESTQANPEISPDLRTLVDELTKVLVDPYPYPDPSADPDNPNPPSNPTDTGDGSSPTPTPITGSASSLWKIYHPTQSQIDSFGAWLWSSAFVDQILKIFNDPMQAIIGLHQVYVTPVDAGTATIKVGYLDSQVPSAYVEQQYVYVDCGSVDLSEQFGNVFDYSPFTDVQLYLPFVGIVPLNVTDVMRSTINVTYGVDVFTGACLAMVEVTRDLNGGVLYQYAGNCAVQYPISSGSYMGIVASIISIAGGIAATAATGGGAAPIVLGAAGAAMNAHTNVQHSGSFSGNSGAMGGKVPYLIITRPQTKLADNFENMQGLPTNAYVSVGECSGYIKASSVHVVNVNATDEELDMINDLLYSGILI